MNMQVFQPSEYRHPTLSTVPQLLDAARAVVSPESPVLSIMPKIDVPTRTIPALTRYLQHGTYSPGSKRELSPDQRSSRPESIDVGVLADQVVSRVIALQLAPLVLGDAANLPREIQIAKLLAKLKRATKGFRTLYWSAARIKLPVPNKVFHQAFRSMLVQAQESDAAARKHENANGWRLIEALLCEAGAYELHEAPYSSVAGLAMEALLVERHDHFLESGRHTRPQAPCNLLRLGTDLVYASSSKRDLRILIQESSAALNAVGLELEVTLPVEKAHRLDMPHWGVYAVWTKQGLVYHPRDDAWDQLEQALITCRGGDPELSLDAISDWLSQHLAALDTCSGFLLGCIHGPQARVNQGSSIMKDQIKELIDSARADWRVLEQPRNQNLVPTSIYRRRAS